MAEAENVVILFCLKSMPTQIIFLSLMNLPPLSLCCLCQSRICDEVGNILFPNGKFQKAEVQLAVSLQTLLDVPEIKAYADACAKRVCLLSYRIDNGNNPSGSQKAFNRYKTIESKATGSVGALLHQAVIESLGFEYRRISYEHSYAL